jgi:hypothetical protein
MKNIWIIHISIFCFLMYFASLNSFGQSLDTTKLKKIQLKKYVAGGLVWKDRSTQNTNWNKICEAPDGRIWFSGGDHWGSDAFDKTDRYDRLWGFGNTAICYYDPKKDKSFVEFELDKASALFSNAETPGHGKIHSNIQVDSEGYLYMAGYLGSSYDHEYTQANFPKSYTGGALIRYSPLTKHVDYFGIPCPNGAVVALYYDEKNNFVNGLTVNRAIFWRINLTTRELFRYEANGRMSRVKDRVREMAQDHEGNCWFNNDFGGLTKFDAKYDTFSDINIKLPGKLMDFRASVMSSKNVLYGISTDGFVWSYDTVSGKLIDYGHVIGMPEEPHYTPNIALDESWGRLYFLAGNHGGPVLEKALETLTILDLKTKKYTWIGSVEGVEGCFGAVVSRTHTVYFNCFGLMGDKSKENLDPNGNEITRPFLVRYDPQKNPDGFR